jgi:hypothetical protein
MPDSVSSREQDASRHSMMGAGECECFVIETYFGLMQPAVFGEEIANFAGDQSENKGCEKIEIGVKVPGEFERVSR